MYNLETRCLARLFSMKETMNNLLANTLQQEIASLQAQLDLVEQRAVSLRATLTQYEELVAHISTVETPAELPVELPVETPYIASPEEDNEVEIELVYDEEEDEAEVELAVETPPAASPEYVPEVLEDSEGSETPELPLEEEKVTEPLSPPVGGVGGGFPIEDIRKAISLGDRFLFQRELFAGNGELMNKTIDKLNTLSSLEEAQKYISKHFSWDTDSQAYELFTNILKRRWQ